MVSRAGLEPATKRLLRARRLPFPPSGQLVRAGRLELPTLAGAVSETAAYADSATLAWCPVLVLIQRRDPYQGPLQTTGPGDVDGAPAGNRNRLCRLQGGCIGPQCFRGGWCWQDGSNTRPHPYEGRALPTELCQRKFTNEKNFSPLETGPDGPPVDGHAYPCGMPAKAQVRQGVCEIGPVARVLALCLTGRGWTPPVISWNFPRKSGPSYLGNLCSRTQTTMSAAHRARRRSVGCVIVLCARSAPNRSRR